MQPMQHVNKALRQFLLSSITLTHLALHKQVYFLRGHKVAFSLKSNLFHCKNSEATSLHGKTATSAWFGIIVSSLKMIAAIQTKINRTGNNQRLGSAFDVTRVSLTKLVPDDTIRPYKTPLRGMSNTDPKIH